MRNVAAIVLTASILLAGASDALANFITTFDIGLEGWTSTGGALSHSAAGGNPGGFLRLQDNTGTFMTVFAPAAFHGDLSITLGGILSFDAKNLNGAAPDLSSSPLFGTVTIVGPAGTASRLVGGRGQPPSDGAWHSYSTNLDQGLWTGDLAAALSNVTSLSVTLESSNITGGEFNGFDNFAIAAVVPEPSGLVLLGAGAVALLGYRAWRRPRPRT